MQNFKTPSYLLSRLLAALGLLVLLWPGDVPWINDEPILISAALAQNRSGSLATHGLTGSHGFAYGPVPIWIYSLLLRITHDLPTIVILRAVLATIGVAVGLIWLASESRRLRPTLGGIVFLSPYVWLYDRMLWDNFAVPIAAVTLAAYVSFCAQPTLWKSWAAWLGMTCLLMVHLNSVPLVAPIVIHGVFAHRRWYREHLPALAAQCIAAIALCFPYLHFLWTQPLAAASAARASAWAGWIFPLFSGRWFSGYGLDYFLGPGWSAFHPGRLSGLIWVTSAAFPLTWMGMGLAAANVFQGFRGKAAERDGDFHLSLLCLGIVASQSILYGWTRAYGQPHYYSATWICGFYFLWLALSWLWGRRPLFGMGISTAYAAALAVVLCLFGLRIHRSAGNRELHYGPALSQQINVARRLAQFSPDSRVYLQVPSMRLFPHALSTIVDLYGLQGAASAPRRTLVVRYADNGNDGRLTVDELR